MPPPILAITLSLLRQEVQRFLGYGRTTAWASLSASFQGDVSSIINRGLRQFYFPPPIPGETSSHQWSFMKKRVAYRFYAPVTTTTTCTASSGTVTFSASTVNTTYRHTVVKFTDQSGYYQVKQTSGSTQVVLWDPSVTFATATTATFYWNRADFDGTGANVNLYYGPDTNNGPLKQVNSEYIMNLEQNQNSLHVGKPAMYSIAPATWPIDKGVAEQEFHVQIYPWADSGITLYGDMRLNPDGMSDDNDIPLGGTTHYETIVASCLAIAEEFGDTPSSKYRELFMQRLSASIMMDRTGMYPSVLGYNGDASDLVGQVKTRNVTVTYTP